MDLVYDFDRFMNVAKKSDDVFEKIRTRKEVEGKGKGKTLRRKKSEEKTKERRFKRNYPTSLGFY